MNLEQIMIMATPLFAILKWILYMGMGGGIAYILYVYFFEYSVIVEYHKKLGNGYIKEFKKKAKRVEDGGTTKYKLFGTKIILKKPDDYTFITMVGRKEKIRILATNDGNYYFLRLEPKLMKYDAIPAEVEELGMILKERLQQKHIDRKKGFEKYAPMMSGVMVALILIIGLWFFAGMMKSASGAFSSVGQDIVKSTENQLKTAELIESMNKKLDHIEHVMVSNRNLPDVLPD